MSMLNRRQVLQASLAGAGLIGLRAMATGLPISFLLNPKAVHADGACADAAQFLILSMSANGDALNCNVPGTYDLPSTFAAGTINHADPADMSMTATQLTIGGKKWTAAKPWSTLPQNVLDRTVFFHHSTGTANHGELGRVLQLFGSLRRGQWLPSYFAKTMRSCFNTVQPQPVTIGGEQLSFEGQYLPKLTPTGLKAVLAAPQDLAAKLQSLRDDTLSKLNQVLKENRAHTTAERAYLDNMALSQTDLRTMIQQVASDLSTIQNDDASNQVTAAALLIKMNVTPVVTIHLPFSGDNHSDANFGNEASQTTASVNNIKTLMSKLKSYGLEDKVTFATLNVFGRTFDSSNGRGHNASHSVSLLIGKGFKGSVVGGIVPGGHAADIDPKTGAAADGGDLAASESLASVAKTLGLGIGLTDEQLNDQITSGTAVGSALA
ncbi:MAG TPA: DUF1501 domain-containing protein [Polyangiaceae bacterium]|nr:DUF1501 domain-containing protein [Polyangiaceae bacterium]